MKDKDNTELAIELLFFLVGIFLGYVLIACIEWLLS